MLCSLLQLPFCAPVMVASAVENMWLCSHKNRVKMHLTEALWLCCGAAGVKVCIGCSSGGVGSNYLEAGDYKNLKIS